MVTALDESAHRSSDPSPRTPVVVATSRRNGKRGRPRREINPEFLAAAIKLRPLTKIAPVTGCSARTLRRRLLDYRLADAGASPLTTEQDPNGDIRHIHHIQPAFANRLTNAELDGYVSTILQTFPNFGRTMIKGALANAGHNVSISRITRSYARVHGTPGRFGRRAIHRKVYHVPGANSLWHHDGQHGESCRTS